MLLNHRAEEVWAKIWTWAIDKVRCKEVDACHSRVLIPGIPSDLCAQHGAIDAFSVQEGLAYVTGF